jgi:metal-sulfur cluster biosynthetic enzyme
MNELANTTNTTHTRATKGDIVEALFDVIDPELGIDVINLGLLYDVEITKRGKAILLMTLTSMGCPFAPQLEQAVKEATQALPGIKKARVEWTFDPPWTSSQITEEGRDQLMALGYI